MRTRARTHTHTQLGKKRAKVIHVFVFQVKEIVQVLVTCQDKHG